MPKRGISKVADQPLKWMQPSAFKKQFELKAGDELVASLQFRSSFGSFATGESADGCWTFKRVGFWQARASVRACDSEIDIASFKDNTWTNGGTLSCADGREFFATTSFWKSKFAFQSPRDRDLILFAASGLLHLSSIVEIRPEARKMAELPWLVMLGWYLTIGKHEDEVSAAAAAAS